MKTKSLNVFILNDDIMLAGKLRRYLLKRFGDSLNISLFFNSKSCLRMINGQVHLVVVDDYLYDTDNRGIAGIDMLRKVKEKDPNTEVIILTSNEDVGTAIEAVKLGARDYIPNERGAWQRVLAVIDQTIKQPIKSFVAEYGVNVFMIVFLSVFVVMGVVVYFALKSMHSI